MGKTQFYTATSIDGYIADEKHSLSWLFDVESDDAAQGEEFREFFGQVGAFAMGATTYEWILRHENALEKPAFWRQNYGDVPCWVFTHRQLPVIPGATLHFVSGDVAAIHRDMTAAAGGRNIWLVGGGELVGCFADAGLLDELMLTVAPVTLGQGAPLLPRRLDSRRLTLTEVKAAGQFVSVRYAVGPA
jgi:dihydrofolate reductase